MSGQPCGWPPLRGPNRHKALRLIPGSCLRCVAVAVLDLNLPVINRIQYQAACRRAVVPQNRIDAPGKGPGISRTCFGKGEAFGFGVAARYLPDIGAGPRAVAWPDIARVVVVAWIGREGPVECRRQAGAATRAR